MPRNATKAKPRALATTGEPIRATKGTYHCVHYLPVSIVPAKVSCAVAKLCVHSHSTMVRRDQAAYGTQNCTLPWRSSPSGPSTNSTSNCTKCGCSTTEFTPRCRSGHNGSFSRHGRTASTGTTRPAPAGDESGGQSDRQHELAGCRRKSAHPPGGRGGPKRAGIYRLLSCS
jgi:hypothetical protein